MYVRRKVFSLGEGNIDYDYNIYQQLYSEAFEDGVDYAIEKMFAEDWYEDDVDPRQMEGTDTNKGTGKGEPNKGTDKGKGTSESAKKDNIFKRAWNKVRDDWWEKGQGWRDGEGDAKKINWKRAGKRAGVIGGGTALVAVPTALAIRHHNKKKAAEAEN